MKEIPDEETREKILRIFQGGDLEFAVRDKNFPEEEFWMSTQFLVTSISELVLDAIEEVKQGK